MLRHEVDLLGRREVGSENDIAFVLPLFVIQHDDHTALPQFVDNLRDLAYWHNKLTNGLKKLPLWPIFMPISAPPLVRGPRRAHTNSA